MKRQEIEEDQPYYRAQGARLSASITDFIRYQRLSWAGHVARKADDYDEVGPPRHTMWTQAAGTTTTKEVLQGTPCGRRPSERLRRRRSSKAHLVDAGRRPSAPWSGGPQRVDDVGAGLAKVDVAIAPLNW